MASKAQAVILLSAAKKQVSTGRCKEAAETAKKALEAFVKVDDKSGMCDAAQLAISALVEASELDDAKKLASAQLTALKSDKTSVAYVRCSLAEVLIAQGIGKEALTTATEAQQAFEALGESKGVIEAKVLVSKAALLDGNSTVALSVAEEAVKLCIESKDVAGEAKSWAAVMAARFAGNSFDKGVSTAKAAAALYGQSGNKKGEATVLMKLATACLEAGDANEALASVNRVFDLLDAKTYPQEIASAVGIMVKTYIKLKQPGEAAKVGRKMSAMLKRSGAKQSTGLALQAVSEASAAAGAHDEAVETAQAAAAIFKELGSKDLEAAALAQVAKLSSDSTEIASGMQAGEEAVELLKGLGNTDAAKAVTDTITSLKNKEIEMSLKTDEDKKTTEAELELDEALINEVGKAIVARDFKAFNEAYYKLEGLNHLTESDINQRLSYVWADDYEETIRWMNEAWIAGSGDKLHSFHRAFMYKNFRVYGMGYGPSYRCNEGMFQLYKPDVMERRSCANLVLYNENREDDWEGILGWHAGMLDAGLQGQSSINVDPLDITAMKSIV